MEDLTNNLKSTRLSSTPPTNNPTPSSDTMTGKGFSFSHKKSKTEVEREKAEEKRKQEEVDRVAALKEYEDHFGAAEDSPPPPPSGRRHFAVPPSGPRRGGFGSFGSIPTGPRAQVGGPGPGGLVGAPPPLANKRRRDGEAREAALAALDEDSDDGSGGVFAAYNAAHSQRKTKPADTNKSKWSSNSFQSQDRRSEMKAAAKPTLLLKNMPQRSSAAAIRNYFADLKLVIDDVKTQATGYPKSNARAATAALVILSLKTGDTEAEQAVKALNNKYLGHGHRLIISRLHTQDATSTGWPAELEDTKGPEAQPFGAQLVPFANGCLSETAPEVDPRAVGRSKPYDDGLGGKLRAPLGYEWKVIVVIPTDLKLLRQIHTVVQFVLANGSEAERYLWDKPENQMDERYEFLFNARSSAGVYYRWRLAEFSQQRYNQAGNSKRLATRVMATGPEWIPPAKNLHLEFANSIYRMYNHPDYESEDEEACYTKKRPRNFNDSKRVDMKDLASLAGPSSEPRYLGPSKQLELVKMLKELPRTIATLPRSDLFSITSFVNSYAEQASDEIAEFLVLNVHAPFNVVMRRTPSEADPDDLPLSIASCSDAEPSEHGSDDMDVDDDEDGDEVAEDEEEKPQFKMDKTGIKFQKGELAGPLAALALAEGSGASPATTAPARRGRRNKRFVIKNVEFPPLTNGGFIPTAIPGKDTSNAHFVGLTVIHYVLISAPTSGEKGATRYRARIAELFRTRRTFTELGKLPKKYDMGLVSKERWFKKVEQLLEMWREAGFFDRGVAEDFSREFRGEAVGAAAAEAKK
ncbi:hypothetical protein K402DRAFT_393251 [Aulographum hederae CBS 113979]|uniref:SURP motif domain-containing protein n=1 Tax=Aulographum hederae CBS 113979 TaxID=1176131 RepID=A0A6G1H1J2_9PEZI|nr:hypothetical protein K402DRAFT_393251 [Aulographum hederae CBS 113979]